MNLTLVQNLLQSYLANVYDKAIALIYNINEYSAQDLDFSWCESGRIDGLR